MKLSLILSLLAALALGLLAHEGDHGRQRRLYPTRCYPGSHCYPEDEDIANLAASISGTVIVPSDAQYPARVFQVNGRWTRHPGIIVVAGSIKDVQHAVLFSRKFYMNLVYSASGLDYQGRGSYDGSLKLDLSLLKSLTSPNVNLNVAGSVKALAGNTWREIYSTVENSVFPRAVAGGSESLDSVDFFTMTGGLGPLSRSLGLAADRLQNVELVLADGRLASVSSGVVEVTDLDGESVTYEDTGLMKALRGGGITYGIPVSFTFGLDFAPGQYGSLTAEYTIVDNDQVIGRTRLRNILQQMVSLPQQWGGYMTLDGSPSPAFARDKGYIRYHLFSYGYYNFTRLGTVIQNLRNIGAVNGANPTTNTLSSLSRYRNDEAEALQHFAEKENTYVMNTLVNANVILNSTRLDEFVDFLLGVVNNPTVDSVYRCVARLTGGKVANPDVDTAVNPKMREALFSLTCALSWDEGSTLESYYVAEALTFQKKLRSFGNGGVDPAYASEDLEDWRTALYGTSYHDLLEVKKKWDVDNFLWAHNAVASDFELNCRNMKCPHHH